jgi:hypothetical protein
MRFAEHREKTRIYSSLHRNVAGAVQGHLALIFRNLRTFAFKAFAFKKEASNIANREVRKSNPKRWNDPSRHINRPFTSRRLQLDLIRELDSLNTGY